MELIDRTDFSSDRKIFDDTQDSKMDFAENQTEFKPEINEKIIEEKPQDEIEEDFLMDSIEIKNDFKNEENKLKKQVGETYPLRVKKRSRKLKGKPSTKSKKTHENENEEVEYFKTTDSHLRDRLVRLEKTLNDKLEFLRTVPLHPRTFAPAKLERMLKDELEYLRTVPLDPRNRLASLEKMLKDEMEYLKTVPSHLRDRFARLEKALKDELEYLKTTPLHPRYRPRRKFQRDAVKFIRKYLYIRERG